MKLEIQEKVYLHKNLQRLYIDKLNDETNPDKLANIVVQIIKDIQK